MAKDTYECIHHGRYGRQPQWLFAVTALNHLALMVNSSVNFIIYCAVGSRFRSALTCRIWGCGGGGGGNGGTGRGGSRKSNQQQNGMINNRGGSGYGRWKRQSGGGGGGAGGLAVNGGFLDPNKKLSPPLSCNMGMTTVGLSQHQASEVVVHIPPLSSDITTTQMETKRRRESGVFIEEEEDMDEEAVALVTERAPERAATPTTVVVEKRKRRSFADLGMRGLLLRQRMESLTTSPEKSRLNRQTTRTSRTSNDTQSSTVDVWL